MKKIIITREISCYQPEITDHGLINPETVIEAIYDDMDWQTENFYALFLNTKNKMLEKHLIAKGAGNQVIVTPANIFRQAVIAGSDSIIIVHNHPSGDSMSSKEDMEFTKKIRKAGEVIGIKILDHVIVTIDKEVYFSFSKAGLI